MILYFDQERAFSIELLTTKRKMPQDKVLL